MIRDGIDAADSYADSMRSGPDDDGQVSPRWARFCRVWVRVGYVASGATNGRELLRVLADSKAADVAVLQVRP